MWYQGCTTDAALETRVSTRCLDTRIRNCTDCRPPEATTLKASESGANTCAEKRLSQDSLPLYHHLFLRGSLSCFQRLLPQLRYRGGFNQHGNEVVTLTLAPTLVSPQHLPVTLVMSILLWPVNDAPTLTLHRSFTPSLGSPILSLRTKDSDVMV